MARARKRKQEPRPRREIETTVYLQPSVRVGTTWTPAKIRSVARNADSGYLAELAELCDELLAYDRVKQAFETRTGALLGLDLTFDPAEEENARAQQLADALGEDWYDAFPEEELSQLLTNGAFAGVALAEIVWTDANGRTIPRLKNWHLKHLRWDTDHRTWKVRVADENQPNGYGHEIDITPGDGKWVVYTPYGPNRPWSRGLWRGLALWWLSADYARSDWARYGEAVATKVGTSPNGANDDDRRELAADLNGLGSDGTIVLPNGFDLHLLEAKADTSSTFEKQIGLAHQGIDIAIKGQNLTTQVDGGSRSAAEVHERVELRIVRMDGARGSTTIQAQALTWWAEFNFADRELAPWPQWDTEPQEDQNDKATRFKDVGEGVKFFAEAGFQVDAEYIQTEYGIPVTKLAVDTAKDSKKAPTNTPPN